MVKRYSAGVDGTDPNGDLVKYDDYAALESRCTAKDEKLRMINELIDAAEQVNKLAQEATERLLQERNALAAENAALKSFGDKLSEMHNDLNGEGTGIQGCAEVACQQVALEAAIEEFDAIKTPATEAFLDEVRAQGVEMFGQYHNFSEKLFIQKEAKKFAAQLRQGADHE